MQLGDSCRRHTSDAAVRPDLVVVLPPIGDSKASLVQCLEPLLIWALVPELAVEALDVAVLNRLTGLDWDVLDAMPVRPGHKDSASELRAVVGPHCPQKGNNACVPEDPS